MTHRLGHKAQQRAPGKITSIRLRKETSGTPFFPMERACCGRCRHQGRQGSGLTWPARNWSKALDRQGKNIADAALGLDHGRCSRINLQLAPQPQDLNIDAPIENIFMNPRRIQEVLA